MTSSSEVALGPTQSYHPHSGNYSFKTWTRQQPKSARKNLQFMYRVVLDTWWSLIDYTVNRFVWFCNQISFSNQSVRISSVCYHPHNARKRFSDFQPNVCGLRNRSMKSMQLFLGWSTCLLCYFSMHAYSLQNCAKLKQSDSKSFKIQKKPTIFQASITNSWTLF